jgi:hypothetical protein
MLRTIFAGLKDTFSFEQSLIERVACKDEFDQEILRLLYEAGSSGLLPKELRLKLEQFRITPHQISRRTLKMNKQSERSLESISRRNVADIGHLQASL